MMQNGGHLALYDNHDALRREIARHSKRDAEAYDRYARDVMRQCKFIKPLLMREPPDPTSFKPRDLQGAAVPWASTSMAWGEERMYRHVALLDHERCGFSRRIFQRAKSSRAHLAGSSIAGTPLGAALAPGRPTCCCITTWATSTTRSALWGFRARRHGARSARRSARLSKPAGGAIRSAAPVAKILVQAMAAPPSVAARGRRGNPCAPLVIFEPGCAPDLSRHHGCVKDLPDEFLRQVKNFKIRGSSGKLNIALDGLPRFPAIPEGSPCTRGDMHADRYDRNDGTGAYDDWKDGRWSQAALHRHAHPVADRSDHGSRRQALHVGLRSVLSLTSWPTVHRDAAMRGLRRYRDQYHRAAQP